MKFKCLFGHKFGKWGKVDDYLERKCLTCGKQEVMFPPWQSVLIKCGLDMLMKYLWGNKQERQNLRKQKENGQTSEDRQQT